MNKYVKRAIIGGLISITLFSIDWMLKHFLFNENIVGQGSEQWNITLLAGRSLLHKSTTFLDFIGIKISFALGQIISWILFALLVCLLLSIDMKLVSIGLGITLSGILGNTLDPIFYNGVRDIFFIPWFDRGTFNLADVLVVLGSAITGLGIIIMLLRKDSNVTTK